jgi:prefoldin subunit 5
MFSRLSSVAVVAFTLTLAGCGDSDESASIEPEQGTVAETPEMSAEGVTAAPVVPASASADAEAIGADVVAEEAAGSGGADDLTAELAKLEDNIESLEQALRNKAERMRDDLQQNLGDLQQERDRLEEKANALQAAGTDVVQDFFKGLNSKLDTLERQIEPAEDR